jgi:ribosomal protein S27E
MLCLGFVLKRERAMSNYKASQISKVPGPRPEFRIVCVNCDALGIVFDFPENAPTSTIIKCRHCGAPRGTLGELRRLSCSDRQDLFQI